MTATNIIVQGGRGHLLADTGWFFDDGRIAFFRSKLIVLLRLKAALTWRGSPIGLPATIAAARIASGAELAKELPALGWHAIAEARKRHPAEPERSWSTTFSLIRYSVRHGRAFGFCMSTNTEYMPPGYRPWTMQPVLECFSPGVDLGAIFGRAIDADDERQFRIHDDGLRVIEAQRRAPWAPYEGGPLAHRVGGAVELATVHAEGASLKTLHRWSDEVGTRIADAPLGCGNGA